MGSDQCIGKHKLVGRCCNGVCFGFGFVVTTITLFAMLWLIWFYFGLTFIHVSVSQRRAIVDYSYVPPSTSSPSRNTPSEIPETSLNQIPKLATASSNFPRIDPTAILEKKSEILNGRQASLAKGDFTTRPRSNKTGETDARRASPTGEAERKSKDKEDAHISPTTSPLSNEQDKDKSIVSDRRGTQPGGKGNLSSNSDDSIIPTRVTKPELDNGKTTYLDPHISTLAEISPSTASNAKLPDNDFTSRNSNFGSNKDLLNDSERNRGFKDRDDSISNRDNKMSKGDIRIIPESQPSSMDRIGLRNNDRDDRFSDSNTRRRGDGDRYDAREDRYRDRIPYDDYRPLEERKREDDKYRPASTRNNRNQDKTDGEDVFVDDRRRGDVEKYDDKPFEDRYRDRIRTDQRYPEERRGDSGKYDDRERRLDRDRSRVPIDDEYLERYPVEERRNRDDFRNNPIREDRFRDQSSDDDRHSAINRDEERNRKNNGKFDGPYPNERGSNDRIPESRYREESRRRYDDRDYDGRKIIREEEYRYSDRFSEDRLRLNGTRSKGDDRYNYQDKTSDSSRYDYKEDPYRGYSNGENTRFEAKEAGRDSIISSRTDYRPRVEETKATRQSDGTRNDRRYLSCDSSYIKGDNMNLGIQNRDRGTLRDEESDKLPQLDRSDRITPTRVRGDGYIPREPNKEPYDTHERRIVQSYPDDISRPSIIDTKYQNNDDRSQTSTRSRIESSRSSPSSRREYYPTDEVKDSPRYGSSGISLERRSYSSEDDEYRLSNTNTRSRTNQRTPYDDRRRDYRSDDPSKRYADEDEYERRRRTNVRNRESVPRDGGLRYDREGNKEDQYREISDRDKYDNGRDRPIGRNERVGEQDRYNRNRDQFDDQRYGGDRYDRDRYDDRDENDRYTRNRDRYEYRYKEERRDQNRDRYDEDRYESGRYDRNRGRYDESTYDRDGDRYRDDAKFEMRKSNRNRDVYDESVEDKYDRSFELRSRDELSKQDDRFRSRDRSITRSRNISPSQPEESFLSPSDVPETPIYPGVGNQETSSRDTRRRDTSPSEYEADRPLSAKDVIDAALRQAESTELSPKKVFYPVFDPRISNLTSSDIIRPSERRGITITSRRRRET